MNKKNIGAILVMLFAICSVLNAQSKFHFHADYHYLLGVAQQTGKYYTINRSDYKMGGGSLHLSGMYSLNKRTAVGIGIGANCYRDPAITTFPIFASINYSSLKKLLSPYLYADIGYSFRTKISEKGFLGDLGIGYKWMFKKHFGMKFELGYNMQQIRVSKENIIVWPDEHGVTPAINGLSVFRHSISIGTGIIF